MGNNKLNNAKIDDSGASDFTINDAISMVNLVNRKHANIEKGGKIVSHIEAECAKEIKHSNDAIERVFLLTDAEEEIEKILLETPQKNLERYAEKIVGEEKITANKKLYTVLEKEINGFKEKYIAKFEHDLESLQKLIKGTSKELPTTEKEKVGYMIDLIIDQDTKVSEIIKMFKIPDQYIGKIKEILGSLQRFKTELSNFKYNAKQKVLQIIPGAMALDNNNPKQRSEKEKGMKLVTIWNKLIDDLCLYYENEIKNT